MISFIFLTFLFVAFVAHHFLLRFFFEGKKWKGSNFVFDPEILHDIAKKGIGKSKDEMFDVVHQELLKLYPDHIAKEKVWLFFNAGGWMGTMCFLHASLSEYIILFGTPSPTSGHSGRYPLEVYDFVMDGEYYKQNELSTDLITFKPGDRAYLPTMKACTFGVKDHMWALEYSRGILPLALPFQMTGTLFATLDFTSLFRMQYVYAKLLINELLVNRKI